jgi:hypothetical protein
LKPNILSRQARDKHRESAHNKGIYTFSILIKSGGEEGLSCLP